ncbi:MAG: hypothetical protein Hens3KO_03280 [Henriciella sp.]
MHRTQVTVTASASGHDEEIRIDLGASDFPASYVFTPSGSDVRVVLASDDTTLVDHIVTGWDSATRTGTIYIKLPTMPTSSSTSVNIYYGDTSLASLGNIDAVFPASGLRLRSRVSTADPIDAASARAAFASATNDVYDSVRASVSGLNNRAIGGSNGNYGWCISAMIEVTPANTGLWEFRYGADFGRGGHLYMRETELEEQWNDDLWWANNFANTAETLEGAIMLDAGWHRYEALGFEGCCDGPVGWQAKAPGGSWQDLSTSNFSMRATRCVVTTVSVSVTGTTSCSTEVVADKSVSVSGDSASPYALPGSTLEYRIAVSNPGQALDTDTVVLTDTLPPETKLVISGANAFTLVDGATSSGLTLNWVSATDTGDDLAFSTDGINFDYLPVADADGADAKITHIRFSPKGGMAHHVDGTPDPSFELVYDVVVE